ncbi:MAG: glycosyltransferase family 4 protein [bacterium]|nr:glycosyltransferase family 4 protein [bacterium]
MKLVYLANFRIPTKRAHGVQIMKMAEAFAKRGIEVELLIPWRFDGLNEDPFVYHQAKKIFKIRTLPNLDLLQWPVGKLGFVITTISFLLSAKFYLFFKRYDVLYTREPLSGLFFSNFILEIHHLPEKISSTYKYFFKKAKLIVMLNNFLKKEIAGAGVPGNKILVFPDCVDLEEFDQNISKETARKKIDLPLDKKIVVYTGSFSIYDWKGVDVLLEAAKSFGNDYLFVGVGAHNEEEMKQLEDRYPLKNILLKYFIPHQSVIWYLKAADILVLPNKSGNAISVWHTSPLKLFEYMAVQRPIISSDLPSIREVVGEEEVFLVKPNKPEDLSKAISFLSGEKDLQLKLAANAYNKVKNYTWDKRVAAIYEKF